MAETDETWGVQPWNPAKHGPLKERAFAFGSDGTGRYSAVTQKGVTVYIPDDHPMVQNYINYGKALDAAQEEGRRREAEWRRQAGG